MTAQVTNPSSRSRKSKGKCTKLTRLVRNESRKVAIQIGIAQNDQQIEIVYIIKYLSYLV